MFRLAHISDIHLGPLPELSFRQLVSKRVTGYYNWQRNRKKMMFGETLLSLTTDMHAQKPDHVCVTGDLVNLATTQEIVAAGAWLKDLGPPRDVSVVPGNHDAYVPGALRKACHEWHNYMVGDNPSAAIGQLFPYVRMRGPVAIFGVSTAEATAPFFATGTFKRGQALQLARMLTACRATGHFCVVLIHHPPVAGSTAWHKRLIGKQYFWKVIREAGADLVLHGHTHLDTLYWIAGLDGLVPVVGVPSASQNPGGDKPAARYNLFDIEGEPGAWTVTQRERGLRPEGAGLGWIRERRLTSRGEAVDVQRVEDTTAVEPA
ncbi:metallophosphatase [Aureimonas endophytica]|uniref:Metallophosphatase n=1 Tax=Aureimonas endophytica TaxID=2027858 RepID=A0A917EBS7_9HYPH|nr:metallophosphoesterase [Aureimonas endophytica]GGE19365.1 metallophosphatase [Aureimonas endophytica]